ncbi:MAG: ADP-ribosylglycohydrolase family protein [Ignavibacteriaceae bacterium]|nr:ADP-ribosylglycohydrolase family protein [Ignavibacteriaceae bacterium]
MIAFLDSTDFEDAIRNAVSLGGDSDTLACITGGIAEAFYKEIPEYIIDKALGLLPKELTEIAEKFSQLKIKN